MRTSGRGSLVALLILTAVAALPLERAGAHQVVPLQRLIDNASAGDTVRIAAGVHRGLFRIERTVALVGDSGAVLDGEGKGTVLTVTADSVHLAGFTVRGSGMSLDDDQSAIRLEGCFACRVEGVTVIHPLHGIYLASTNGSYLVGNIVIGNPGVPEARRGNGIHLFNSTGITITRNRITGTRDGIYFSFASGNRVDSNSVTGVRYGLHYMYSNDNVFERNHFSRNAAGGALMFSDGIILRDNDFTDHIGYRAYGLLLQTARFVKAERNRFTGNLVGLFLDNSSEVEFRNNVIAGNGLGLDLLPSASNNTMVGNSFVNNRTHVRIARGSGKSTWSENGRGNYWGSREVFDLDRDGVGDRPYRVGDAFATLAQARPALELFAGTPAALALSWAEEALPVFSVLRVVDPAPLAVAEFTQAAGAGAPLLGPALAGVAVMALLFVGLGLTDRVTRASGRSAPPRIRGRVHSAGRTG